ncbi:MAG: hypothetical protein FJZ56_05520, partial [Chlamydiae bacterium]|nr:hypothetical protein [Chlamydiota bacterium]
MNEIYRVLDRNSPMRGQFFLEASAGTGKTFTIEHMVVRLLITEPVMSLDQILVVTFTKAATRELRQRIYAKIQESLRMWKEESLDAPDYLQSLFGDETTFLRLERAKALIEEAPIYTIHSFCMKMLSSNAFEAKVSLSPLEEEEDIENLLDVFRSLEPYKEFSPNEIFALLQKHQRDIYSICRSLKGVKKIEGANFEQRWLQEGSNLSKEEFDEQMKKNSDETLSKLASYAAKHVRLSPDEFLTIMQSSLKNPNFVHKVRNRFQAAIIDEFQDTDPLQWEIFFKLFVENPLPFLCFVGDPKQSIYAFRNADIHTFVHARNFFSPYVLSTNYRSHPTLLEALNFLFDNESKWLGDKIAYIPVSGKEGYEKPLIEDGKGAIHILHAKCEKKSSRKWPSESVELEILFPNIANEILSLNLPFSSIAILVKDRFQGKRLSSYLQTLNIACVTKNSGLITDTKAFVLFYNFIKKHETISWQILEEWILTCDLEDYEDLMHLSELALEQGSSSHTLLKWMDSIKAKSSDSDPNVKKRTLKDGECVQIMTVHASKGLEFDVVFSLGLASRQKEEEPSLDKDEEKMRLLYVAFTRAKRRLYIPYLEIIDEKKRPVDSLSAIEMFFDKVFFQKNWQEKILSSQKSISIEEITKNSSAALKAFESCDLIQPPLIQIE